MASLTKALPRGRARVRLLAALLFANAMVMESNEVVATSGFVSRIGSDAILLVWAADMAVVIVSSGVYSLVVDRMKRESLAVSLFIGFSVVYAGLWALFHLGAPDWVSYPLLTVLNDQQWLLMPMVVWALANDLFSTAEAKRLFPILGGAAFAGGIFGNALTAGASQWVFRGERGSLDLLLLNAGLLVLMALLLSASVRRWLGGTTTVRQSREGERVLDTLREGVAFVREVPAYRYLTLSMVVLGIGLNVVEYQLIVSASRTYLDVSGFEGFYAILRAARILLMVLVQGMAAAWLLERLGFKTIFAVMPVALLTGLVVAFLWPVLLGIVVAEYLARIALEGIDEPSRRAFFSMVPDERRGRVSAFMDGYLYPLGSILSCALIGAILLAVGRGLLARETGQAIYLGLAALCVGVSMWAVTRFRGHYDESMLNWRLKRRRRAGVLSNLEL